MHGIHGARRVFISHEICKGHAVGMGSEPLAPDGVTGGKTCLKTWKTGKTLQ